MQSFAFNASASDKVSSTTLQDIIISYQYELEAKDLTKEQTETINELFKAKLNAYMATKGDLAFKAELKKFLKSLPSSDYSIQILSAIHNINSKNDLEEALVSSKNLSKTIAGDSANWTSDFVSDPLMIGLALAAVALVTYLIVEAQNETEEDFGNGNNNTGSVDGTQRIVLYFNGSDSVTHYVSEEEQDEDPFIGCSDFYWSTSRIEDNAVDEARWRCRADSRVIEQGLQSACNDYVSVSTSGSLSFDTLTCRASATLTVSYTIGDDE